MDPYPSTYLNLGDDTLAWLAMSAFRPAVHVVTWARAVADPVGSLDRPRTTHKFGPKFYYYS